MRKISECYKKSNLYLFFEKGSFYVSSFSVAIKLEKEQIQILGRERMEINSGIGYSYRRMKKNI